MLEIIAENGNVRDFGFDVQGNIKDYFVNIFEENIVYIDVNGESVKHWVHIIPKMKENYNQSNYKEFIDWFLTTDFVNWRKKYIFEYRRKKFLTLLKEKLKN